MADMLSDGSDWVADQLKSHASRSVTYSRSTASVALTVTIGETIFQAVSEVGAIIHTHSRDYLFRAEDLVLGGSATLPHRGDRITDDGKVYEVLAPGREPHYRFTDPYQFGLRVHTKQVE